MFTDGLVDDRHHILRPKAGPGRCHEHQRCALHLHIQHDLPERVRSYYREYKLYCRMKLLQIELNHSSLYKQESNQLLYIDLAVMHGKGNNK